MMNKIMCVLKDKGFKEKLEEVYSEIKVDSEVFYSQNLDLNEIDAYTKIIIDEEQVKDSDKVNQLVQMKGNTNIVLLTNGLNTQVSKQFLFTGIHIHYVDSPIYALINKLEGISTIENAKTNIQENLNKDGQKLVAVTSPAGGNGKTTISLNLADVLSEKGKKVLLVDMSIHSDIAAKLQIQHKNGFNNVVSSILQDFGKGSKEKRIAAIKNNIYRYQKKNQFFDILYGINPIKAEKINSEVVEEMVKTIREFDYEIVIFDTCSNVSEMNLALVECVDTILVIALPDVGNGWKLIQQKELYECIQVTKKCRLIINRYSKNSGFSCKQLERELQYPLMGVIPHEDQVAFAANNGKLISQSGHLGTLVYINYLANQIENVFNPAEIKIKKINT